MSWIFSRATVAALVAARPVIRSSVRPALRFAPSLRFASTDADLKATLKEDLKKAMRSGDKTRTVAIKSILSDITYAEKAGTDVVPSVSTLIQRSVKKRQDAAEQYRAADRADLAEKEEYEISVLKDYLPKQLSEQEVEVVVRAKAAEIGATGVKDLGKVMKEVGPALDGSAPKKLISEVVKRVLQSL
ncbi:Yqey-like protein-domain-containing protein [Polychytrium aggregatum]|uniref:Yqey-like protein-domain-containing protein n=1 Tax=Polychytrium aggregatum TaxID=110093 RepID=UPI0022FEC6A7|nr:Yqey-like protein-domain-containing protein [Polychytrium aggregatum]KAI9199504.1 Yqey-like protein-domain-containing protein [Polychytrium aggregatum]